jgi:hypothetical protein
MTSVFLHSRYPGSSVGALGRVPSSISGQSASWQLLKLEALKAGKTISDVCALRVPSPYLCFLGSACLASAQAMVGEMRHFLLPTE